MDDGVVHRLQHRHTDGSVVIAHMAEVAEMKQPLLDRGQKRGIRLYNKMFRHRGRGINQLQKYTKFPTHTQLYHRMFLFLITETSDNNRKRQKPFL